MKKWTIYLDIEGSSKDLKDVPIYLQVAAAGTSRCSAPPLNMALGLAEEWHVD